MLACHFPQTNVLVNVVTSEFVSLQGWRSKTYIWAKKIADDDSVKVNSEGVGLGGEREYSGSF